MADITYVRTRSGFVYTAFVTDVFSRKIVGGATASTTSTESLPLQALNQAIHTAKTTQGLIHHSDHGSQYVSVAYHSQLAAAGIVESTGSIGDSYDNALAENVNGSYKNELIHNPKWNSLAEVEMATLEWVHWWNTARLHENLAYRTPQETEEDYWKENPSSVTLENKVNS